MAEKKKKSLSAFEKAFAAARKKAGGPDGIFTFKVGGKDKKFTTAYDGEKTSKKTQEKKKEKKAVSSGVSIKDLEPLGESKLLAIGAKKVIGDKKPAAGKVDVGLSNALRNLKNKDKEILAGKKRAGMGGPSAVSVTVLSASDNKKKDLYDTGLGKRLKGMVSGISSFIDKRNEAIKKDVEKRTAKDSVKDVKSDIQKVMDKNKAYYKKISESSTFKTLPSKTQRMIKNIIEGKIPMGQEAKEKKIDLLMKSAMNVGGLTQSSMMNGLSRKVNPTTGLTMNKGGMTDYRKSGMFYGGGMARRGR